MPPADVLLAAAVIAGIPFGSGEDEPPAQAEIEQEWRTLIRPLQSQVDELQNEVRNLSGQIVIPPGSRVTGRALPAAEPARACAVVHGLHRT